MRPRTAVAQGSRVDAVLTLVLAVASLIGLALPERQRENVAGGVRRTVGAPLLNLQERAERTRASFLAHDSTNRVLDSLALESADVRALRSENEHLRRLLGLAARLRWGFIAADAGFVPAEALGDRGLGLEVTVTLNVGSTSGVVRYAPVISPAGLVGRVSSVDPSTSLVELFSHETFRVSAMTADQRVVGIVSAHRGSGGDLDDEYLLEMGGVQFRDTLRTGTVIYTSGLGGTVPAYIPVGTVVRELGSAELWARTYLLRPMVRPSEIRSVVVLLPERSAAGVAGVWVEAPDSAARAAAAAGDSLARITAAAEQAARTEALRQRLLDSLRAAGVPLETRDSAAAAPRPAPAAPTRPAPPGTPPAAAPVTPRPAVPAAVPPRPPVRRDTARPDTARTVPPPRPDTQPPPESTAAGSPASAR